MKLGVRIRVVRWLLAGGLVASAGCASNPQAKSPGLDQGAAVVVYGANVMRVADVACAAAGQDLRAQGQAAKAADVTGKCVAALKPAADSLETAAAAINAGAAISDGQVACAVAMGADALVRVRAVLADLGKLLPESVDRYVRLAAPWVSIAEGMVCKS